MRVAAIQWRYFVTKWVYICARDDNATPATRQLRPIEHIISNGRLSRVRESLGNKACSNSEHGSKSKPPCLACLPAFLPCLPACLLAAAASRRCATPSGLVKVHNLFKVDMSAYSPHMMPAVPCTVDGCSRSSRPAAAPPLSYLLILPQIQAEV